MKNQHKHIKGYRDLSEAEIAAMNRLKEEGTRLGEIIASMKENSDLDQRWVAIAETHLQQGIMAAIRAVAQPTTF